MSWHYTRPYKHHHNIQYHAMTLHQALQTPPHHSTQDATPDITHTPQHITWHIRHYKQHMPQHTITQDTTPNTITFNTIPMVQHQIQQTLTFNNTSHNATPSFRTSSTIQDNTRTNIQHKSLHNSMCASALTLRHDTFREISLGNAVQRNKVKWEIIQLHTHTHLGSMTVPAQVLCEAVEADVVGLTLRPGWAEGQAVAVFLHLLYLHTEREGERKHHHLQAVTKRRAVAKGQTFFSLQVCCKIEQ